MTAKRKSSKKPWRDPDDAPDLSKGGWFQRADLYLGDKLIRAGRPKGSGSKELISLRIDKEVIAAFKATGPGWQTRINETLQKSTRKLSAKSRTSARSD